jgi:hypothetical protein
MKIFLVTFIAANGQPATVAQRATNKQHAIQTVRSTGAIVNNAREIDYEAFNLLWPFIGGLLDMYDDDAQSMALRLMEKGIETREQWLAAGEVIA